MCTLSIKTLSDLIYYQLLSVWATRTSYSYHWPMAFPLSQVRHFAIVSLREMLTCLCLISSFFCSRKAEGMPAMFSWALSSRGHRSFMNSRAFFPFRKPVRLICIILLSGCCNTHTKGGEKKTIRPLMEGKISGGSRYPLVLTKLYLWLCS